MVKFGMWLPKNSEFPFKNFTLSLKITPRSCYQEFDKKEKICTLFDSYVGQTSYLGYDYMKAVFKELVHHCENNLITDTIVNVYFRMITLQVVLFS